MTANEWVDGLVPPPPPRLRQRLAQLVSAHVAGDVTPESLVRASGAVLASLLSEGELARESALELLAADALATYAFELQAGDPGGLDARCEWAMRHLSGVADGA